MNPAVFLDTKEFYLKAHLGCKVGLFAAGDSFKLAPG
jgi:hypothetical protein